MPPRHRVPLAVSRLGAPIGTLAAVCAAFTYVGLVDPGEPGHYPVCPLLHFTGIYCPGCGGLRCAHAIAHGDLRAALSDNALAVAGFVAFAVFMVFWLVRAARAQAVTLTLRSSHGWVLGGLALVFTVVRNLPLGAALAP